MSQVTLNIVNPRQIYATKEEAVEANRKKTLENYHKKKELYKQQRDQKKRETEIALQWYRWMQLKQQQNPKHCPCCDQIYTQFQAQQ